MSQPRPIYLFSDFGVQGPYVGQLHAALHRHGYPGVAVDLQHDAPRFDPVAAGLLLASLLDYLPANALLIAVVDPGVGSERAGLVVQSANITLVGPDNGLFAPLWSRAPQVQRIAWQPVNCSASFHGRDWFAPVAARLAMRQSMALQSLAISDCVTPSINPAQVIYCDHFGNAMTGLNAAHMPPVSQLQVAGQTLSHARTFSDVSPGGAFWYINSLGLVEIAVNQGSAQVQLNLRPGTPVAVAEVV